MSWENVLRDLEAGIVRAARRNTDGSWVAVTEVKEAILAAFRAGNLVEMSELSSGLYAGFVDKDSMRPQRFRPEQKVRLVPGGSAVRRGAFVAPGVVIMPPAYVNVGAYIGEGSMVDSHVLVGSCAQIGARVHLSAGVQIGGVLEPVGQTPVVIEDDVFVGAGSVIVEGILVRERAVIAPGVILSRAVSVYDVVNERILPRGAEIPAGAVVVPGSRPIRKSFAEQEGLSLNTPIIIKYRDAKSDAALTLEDALR